jgi:hypothetical protein
LIITWTKDQKKKKHTEKIKRGRDTWIEAGRKYRVHAGTEIVNSSLFFFHYFPNPTVNIVIFLFVTSKKKENMPILKNDINIFLEI